MARHYDAETLRRGRGVDRAPRSARRRGLPSPLSTHERAKTGPVPTPVGPVPADPNDPDQWDEWYQDDDDQDGDDLGHGARFGLPVRLTAAMILVGMVLLYVLAR